MTWPFLPDGFDPESAPVGLRRFYHDFFIEPIAVLRGEADLGYIADLDEPNRRMATELVRLNLRPLRSSVLTGAEALRAQALTPELTHLLEQVDDPSTKLEVARALVRITDEPGWIRPPLQSMVGSSDATLKEVHFADIRLLPPDEQLDMFFALLQDPHSSFVRFLALVELNGLQHRKLYFTADVPHGEDYYLERRDDLDLRARLLTAVTSSRANWEVVT